MNRVLFTLAAFSTLAIFADPVRLDSGLVSGADGRITGVRVYKGIPYAAPPVGDMRWKPPAPPAPWTGVKAATEFSPVCMQNPYPETSIYYSPLPNRSEDCLYLNVWTAAKTPSDRRPVMIWIHGGGFTRGSGSTPTYDGENFAQKGVVLVTVNYRLAAFGFLAHPDLTAQSPHHSSGNYGLLDQIAALEWVKRNIAAFGGDPKRVTIFGESAGSSAVNFLQASPLAKGLFQRAIGESGANFARGGTLADLERAGAKYSLTELRSKSAEDLLKMEIAARPGVDGCVVPASVASIFAQGKQNDVPVIAGSNADESRTLAPYSSNQSAFLESVRKRFGASSEEFLKLYPVDSEATAAEAHYASTRDQGMGWNMRTWAREQAKTGKAPAFLYYFTRIPPGPDADKYRAYHAAEIQYVFGNLSPKRPWEDTDRKLSDAMLQYWVNFAVKGDPNGPGLPPWPRYDATVDAGMEFGNSVVVKRNINKTALDFFDRLAGGEGSR
ncbi:MAG TPA: carboxylesterase family protein [Bryobacteraceae bacterium]|nr:carboxylesterase family protein [Bryobacteraceae bacterium]